MDERNAIEVFRRSLHGAIERSIEIYNGNNPVCKMRGDATVYVVTEREDGVRVESLIDADHPLACNAGETYKLTWTIEF